MKARCGCSARKKGVYLKCKFCRYCTRNISKELRESKTESDIKLVETKQAGIARMRRERRHLQIAQMQHKPQDELLQEQEQAFSKSSEEDGAESKEGNECQDFGIEEGRTEMEIGGDSGFTYDSGSIEGGENLSLVQEVEEGDFTFLKETAACEVLGRHRVGESNFEKVNEAKPESEQTLDFEHDIDGILICVGSTGALVDIIGKAYSQTNCTSSAFKPRTAAIRMNPFTLMIGARQAIEKHVVIGRQVFVERYKDVMEKFEKYERELEGELTQSGDEKSKAESEEDTPLTTFLVHFSLFTIRVDGVECPLWHFVDMESIKKDIQRKWSETFEDYMSRIKYNLKRRIMEKYGALRKASFLVRTPPEGTKTELCLRSLMEAVKVIDKYQVCVIVQFQSLKTAIQSVPYDLLCDNVLGRIGFKENDSMIVDVGFIAGSENNDLYAARIQLKPDIVKKLERLTEAKVSVAEYLSPSMPGFDIKLLNVGKLKRVKIYCAHFYCVKLFRDANVLTMNAKERADLRMKSKLNQLLQSLQNSDTKTRVEFTCFTKMVGGRVDISSVYEEVKRLKLFCFDVPSEINTIEQFAAFRKRLRNFGNPRVVRSNSFSFCLCTVRNEGLTPYLHYFTEIRDFYERLASWRSLSLENTTYLKISLCSMLLALSFCSVFNEDWVLFASKVRKIIQSCTLLKGSLYFGGMLRDKAVVDELMFAAFGVGDRVLSSLPRPETLSLWLSVNTGLSNTWNEKLILAALEKDLKNKQTTKRSRLKLSEYKAKLVEVIDALNIPKNMIMKEVIAIMKPTFSNEDIAQSIINASCLTDYGLVLKNNRVDACKRYFRKPEETVEVERHLELNGEEVLDKLFLANKICNDNGGMVHLFNRTKYMVKKKFNIETAKPNPRGIKDCRKFTFETFESVENLAEYMKADDYYVNIKGFYVKKRPVSKLNDLLCVERMNGRLVKYLYWQFPGDTCATIIYVSNADSNLRVDYYSSTERKAVVRTYGKLGTTCHCGFNNPSEKERIAHLVKSNRSQHKSEKVEEEGCGEEENVEGVEARVLDEEVSVRSVAAVEDSVDSESGEELGKIGTDGDGSEESETLKPVLFDSPDNTIPEERFVDTVTKQHAGKRKERGQATNYPCYYCGEGSNYGHTCGICKEYICNSIVTGGDCSMIDGDDRVHTVCKESSELLKRTKTNK